MTKLEPAVPDGPPLTYLQRESKKTWLRGASDKALARYKSAVGSEWMTCSAARIALPLYFRYRSTMNH